MLASLSDLLDRALGSQFRSINGMVVVRKGRIVYERYNGRYGPEDAHDVASVAKSVTSALIGIAIASGNIKSVDERVLDFFPDYATGPDAASKFLVTIRHLLTMTAPFALTARGMRSEPLDRLRRQRDWVAYILSLMGRNDVPGKFRYSSAGSHLLSAIITRATGVSAREYANDRLFRPMGTAVTGWSCDPAGNTAGGWGLAMTPRDMARFGLLYLRRGSWEGRQVVPESWVHESTAPNANGYGYCWWLKGTGDIFTFSAAGTGGSHIYCTPGKDLVVAVASSISGRPRDRWWLLENCIFPSIAD